MNHLPTASIAARLHAMAAAAVVTLAMLSGIDSLALAQGGELQSSQAAVTQPA